MSDGFLLLREDEREEDGSYENAEDDHQRHLCADFKMQELVPHHFHADETEQQAQAIAQKPELVGNIVQQEEERPQSHDGEDVGEIDHKGVGGDGEDRRNAVDSKDDIAELDDQQHQEERGHVSPALFADEEIVSVDLTGDGEEATGELDGRMVGGIDGPVVFLDEHLDAAIDKDNAENGQHPREFADCRPEEENKEEPQHDGAQNAPEKDAMVVALVDAEADKNHNHHEDVVDGERLFEEIAGEVLVKNLLAVDFECRGVVGRGGDERRDAVGTGIVHQAFEVSDAVNPFGTETQQNTEKHSEDNPYARPDGGFLDFDDMVFLVEHTEVKCQHDHDKHHEEYEKERT